MAKEWVPWYRRKDYKGNLSEEEKRLLDSFRMKEKHPSASSGDLPNEVQSYISNIEFELYDMKQGQAAAKALVFTFVAALLVYLGYIGQLQNELLGYVGGAVLTLFAWFQYRREWRKNADEFTSKSNEKRSRTDEGILTEWELECITQSTRNP